MATKNRYLDEVYQPRSPAENRALYDDWAESYDEEVTAAGYATPARCARALVECGADRARPVLDFGCGTGLSGAALAEAGFTTIDGLDQSPGMLERARARGLYRSLTLSEPGKRPALGRGSYDTVAAVGVISPASAPPETIDLVMRTLRPGGLFAFSFNAHTLKDRRFECRVMEHVDCGAALVLRRDLGPNLPGIGLDALVYVLRKG